MRLTLQFAVERFRRTARCLRDDAEFYWENATDGKASPATRAEYRGWYEEAMKAATRYSEMAREAEKLLKRMGGAVR